MRLAAAAMIVVVAGLHVYFLVLEAGLYGAATVGRRILFIQALLWL